MRRAIVSFGFDRPEMLEASFKSIIRCPEHREYEWHCFIDGQGRVQRNFYQEDYPDIRFHIRDSRIGLNANILLAFKELFQFHKYDYILYVEDDIIVSDDFIRFCEYALFNFKDEKMFTVGALSRILNTSPDDAASVKRFDWYHPWGVAIDRDDFNLFSDHIMPYVTHPIEYMNGAIKTALQESNPEYYEREYKDGVCQNYTQDCLLNAIRAINHKHQLIPLLSRSQNIGFYGVHQPGDYNGEDLSNPDTWLKSRHATANFQPPYSWDKLNLIDGVEK